MKMNQQIQTQYRSLQQSAHRNPHTSSRRGPGPMITGHNVQSGAPHPSITQTQNKYENDQQEKEAAKRRAKRPTDKNIPEGVEDVIIGEGVQQYRDLRDVERRLDALMMRKRLDLQEPRPQSLDRTRTLRVWISNTAENQPWQGRGLDENAFDFNSGIEGTYKVKIEGRLLESEGREIPEDEDVVEEDDAVLNQNGQQTVAKKSKTAPKRPRQKLSWFFKQITIDYDRLKNLQPDGMSQIEWKKPSFPQNIAKRPAGADFDCLEFERKGDENINCTINLHRDERPERFVLSKALSDIVDFEEGTRDVIIMGLWEYIRVMKLQQNEDKRLIQCDDRLRTLFKSDTVYFPHMYDLIFPHITPLPPLRLPYTIRVDPEYHASPVSTVYDILVSERDPLCAQMQAVIHEPKYATTLQEITKLDNHLATIVQGINNSKAKHAFYTSMSKDPATFIRRWTSSQKRDLDIILGEATRGGGEDGMAGEFRRGGKEGVWGSETAREAVELMLFARDKPRS